jgi:hypothetical protein
MIVGATLPSARVGEGLETTQLSRFVALPAWVCLGACVTNAPSEYDGAERAAGEIRFAAPNVTVQLLNGGAALMLAASAIAVGLSRSALNFDPAKTQVRR